MEFERREVKNTLVDFCIFWGKLTAFIDEDIKNKNGQKIVNWSKCNQPSLKERYEGKVFDIEIDVSKATKKREAKAKDKAHEFDSLDLDEEVKTSFECQIWCNYVDLVINLQWLSWSRTFWFDCLISWIHVESACPNCRHALTKSDIRPNKELMKMIGFLNIESRKLRNVLCNEHKIESTLFWITWVVFIWNKWIISNTHRDHKLSENKNAIKLLQDKVGEELMDKRTSLLLLQSTAKKALFYELQNEWIWEIALKPYYKKLDKIKMWFKDEISNIVKSKESILNYSINKRTSNEKLLNLFKETGEHKLIDQVSNALKEVNSSSYEAESSVQKFYQKIKKPELLIEDIFYKIPYEYAYSSQLRNKEFTSIIDQDTKVNLTINKNDQRIYAEIIINIKNKNNSEWLWRVEQKSNLFWSLTENFIVLVPPNKNSLKIGNLSFNGDFKFLDNNTKLDLFLLKVDKCILSHLEQTDKHIINELMLDQYDRSINKSHNEEENEPNLKDKLSIKSKNVLELIEKASEYLKIPKKLEE